jgi:Immunity protein Imm1
MSATCRGPKPPFDEIWVNLPDGQALCALINGDKGWLMYLRKEGDAGFSSRNPDYDGPPDAEIEYELSNGQHDCYPASWALPVKEVRRALDFFEKQHKPPSFVAWFNDSRDGATIS